jgi:tungstate transport system substrate-binding protein
MRRIRSFVSVLVVFLCLRAAISCAEERGCLKFDAVYGRGDRSITVATGSPGELGLLKSLAESFSRETPCRIRWIKMGSGKALDTLKAGKADTILVHAPQAEKRAVEEGWACMRTLLGGNEFYIVGPNLDPAEIRDAESAADAYARIAKKRARFFSRGDGSGTHKREMKIWEMAGIKPEGDWYIVTHEFMGPTLKRADKEEGYFMTDSSTLFVNRADLKNLIILFKGDPILVNVYHGLLACAGDRGSSRRLSQKFLKFIVSAKGQKILRDYGKKEYGAPLYNDAEHARE